MRKRQLSILLALVLLTIPIVGCTPAFDGFKDGLTDGLSAATSTFVEEFANSLVGAIVPDDGA